MNPYLNLFPFLSECLNDYDFGYVCNALLKEKGRHFLLHEGFKKVNKAK